MHLFLITLVFDYSTVSDGPHDKVFKALCAHPNNQDVACFPAPASLWINEEASFFFSH